MTDELKQRQQYTRRTRLLCVILAVAVTGWLFDSYAIRGWYQTGIAGLHNELPVHNRPPASIRDEVVDEPSVVDVIGQKGPITETSYQRFTEGGASLRIKNSVAERRPSPFWKFITREDRLSDWAYLRFNSIRNGFLRASLCQNSLLLCAWREDEGEGGEDIPSWSAPNISDRYVDEGRDRPIALYGYRRSYANAVNGKPWTIANCKRIFSNYIGSSGRVSSSFSGVGGLLVSAPDCDGESGIDCETYNSKNLQPKLRGYGLFLNIIPKLAKAAIIWLLALSFIVFGLINIHALSPRNGWYGLLGTVAIIIGAFLIWLGISLII